jgi:hypothetical protein
MNLGGNILAGGLLILFVLVITLLTAFVQEGTEELDGFARCDEEGNTTVCETSSTSSFASAVADVSISGLDGAPLIFNGLYLLVTGSMLVLGVVLIVLGIFSVAFGGG